jgi:hypothetical protein
MARRITRLIEEKEDKSKLLRVRDLAVKVEKIKEGLKNLSVRTIQCTFLPTLFATITLLFHSHLNSYYHFTLSFQRYRMSLLFTICLIRFAYNFTLLSYVTIDQKGICVETVRTAD